MVATKLLATKAEMSKFYDDLRSVSKEAWKRADADDIGESLSLGQTADLALVGQTVMLAAQIAHQTNRNQFIEFLESGDIPPIKLSEEQLQILKGGEFWKDIAKIMRK